MELIVSLAALAVMSLLWLIWQLVKAKRFTRFKQQIETDLKAKVIENIKEELEHTRSEIFPNNLCHEEAAILYWTQYKSRILHAALNREIIDQQWLTDTGNLRNAQHLFFVERQYLPIARVNQEQV
ncbi:hypothetical protein [Colwellia echini]|uniref:DUF2489 domain-containing protein n=1 Tax=Colwellia echini TaxID=1982103 RepID=A0ABY3MV68_9GAMM|nr:hypothetical protein [Colwellia echini]TYK65103.1 hypothetical protein CWS31_012480 [Colwellia echini]